MYLKKITLKNFRKFGGDASKNDLEVNLHPGLNVIVGENDSGKTAIIDAIKLLLGTVSEDFDRIQDEDFYCNSEGFFSENFFIEGIFDDLDTNEAGLFLEWLSFNEKGNYQLRLILEVTKKKNDNGQEFIERQLLAGEKNCENKIDSRARSLLRATYLKPLRDANSELRPGFKSRLAQILRAHSSFKQLPEEKHALESVMEKANFEIESYFSEEYEEGKSIKSDIESILSEFYDVKDSGKANTDFSVTPANLKSILNKLSLNSNSINLGLGNMNLLFIATELLLLNNSASINSVGPHVTLIEELEAHLHTQAQIRLVKYLEQVVKKGETTQFILTSHSTHLVSSISPKNLIYLNNGNAYPLSHQYTLLENEDYEFLERFLDSTKSNLFFAKGLILVEGDSEMLLIPAIAELIGLPLHQYGISLVNIGGTSFERYIKLFSTNDSPSINLPISLVTDVDVRPIIYFENEDKLIYQINNDNMQEVEILIGKSLIDYDGNETEYTSIESLMEAFEIEDSVSQKKLTKITKQTPSDKAIKEEIKRKMKSVQEKYAKYNANLNISISPEWTLEYCLLQSPLQKLLKDSILETQYKKPFRSSTQKTIDSIEADLKNPEKKSTAIYLLFKRLNDKQVSKAIVAQRLASKILNLSEEEKRELREQILIDQYTDYLISAIIHASGRQKSEVEINE
ncbi:ATP-dependent nuclease [Enterococcus spodopteracolus]|uniref:ATP-dependent nuclease n=1 Tax=Enterococcus spodopteracolus TaxID=3034501 RepID=UPI0026482BDD|nr:AAA family ATPase [Enterococcus spodopteracolus]